MTDNGKVKEVTTSFMSASPLAEGNVTANLLNSISELYPENLFQKPQVVLSSGNQGVRTLPVTSQIV